MRALRIEGSPDEVRVTVLANRIRRVLPPGMSAVTQGYAAFDRETGGLVAAFGDAPPEYARHMIRHPDIMIMRGRKLACIVELDGSIHDTGPGRRKTERRDSVYRDSGVPYIVLHDPGDDIGQVVEVTNT